MKLILFYNILEMSLKASFIILIVLVMRLYLKEKPKAFSYALWIIVFVRLICPLSFELPFSFIPENVSNGVVMKDMTDTYVGDYEIHWNYTEEFDTALAHGIEPAVQKDESGEIENAYVVTAQNGASTPETVYEAWLPELSNLWIFGMAGIFVYSFLNYLKMKKKLVGAVPYDEEQDIYLSDYIETAFVIGTFYPKIYLPSSLSKNEQKYIFWHERHHIRRKDHLIKMAAFTAFCIHWFNPLVWIAFLLMTKDMEMSCDEAVLRKLGSEIQEEYSASLLSLATGKRVFAATPLPFGEGSTKARIENAMKWKKPSFKTEAVTSVLCILVGTVSLANVENTILSHPIEWTSTVKFEDIDDCVVTSWEDEALQFWVTDNQIKEFVYVLNELSKDEITKETTIAKKEITVLFTCGRKEYVLTYGNGITMISFDHDTGLEFDEKVWQTDDEQLAKCIRNMISQGIRAQNIENGITIGPLAPTKEEVLEMRKKALEGMSEKEIARLTELVQVENQSRESVYVKGNQNAEFQDPDSLYWNLLTQSGKVQVGWGITCEAPGLDPNGDMTEDEYYEMYGIPYVYEVEVPWSEELYARVREFRSLVKNDFLEADFEALEKCMRLAVETHDVNYLHKVYYILHDMDYYLLRYGPEDVGKITDDDSTARKYYGVLKIYEDSLPSIVSAKLKIDSDKYEAYWESGFECITKSYYQMSDGSFRTEVTQNDNGLTTEVFSYKHCIELQGINPILEKKVKCVVLSNSKNVSFEDVQWEEKEYNGNLIKGYDPTEAIIVSVQLDEL